MDLVHVAVALISEAPDMIEVFTFFDVVGLIGMHEPQLHLADATLPKRLVGLLD